MSWLTYRIAIGYFVPGSLAIAVYLFIIREQGLISSFLEYPAGSTIPLLFFSALCIGITVNHVKYIFRYRYQTNNVLLYLLCNFVNLLFKKRMKLTCTRDKGCYGLLNTSEEIICDAIVSSMAAGYQDAFNHEKEIEAVKILQDQFGCQHLNIGLDRKWVLLGLNDAIISDRINNEYYMHYDYYSNSSHILGFSIPLVFIILLINGYSLTPGLCIMIVLLVIGSILFGLRADGIEQKTKAVMLHYLYYLFLQGKFTIRPSKG